MTRGTNAKRLSAVLVVAVLVVAVGAYADADADRRTAANSKLSSKVRLEACERLLAAEGLSKTERTWALLQRSMFYRWAEEYDKSLADLAEAEKLDPGNPRIHRDRAHAYFNNKKYTEAEAELTTALKLDPRYAWSWYVRGRTRVRLRKYDEALTDYDKALELSPRYFDAYSGRARLHVRRKDYDKAIRDCDGALALDPYYAGAYYVRGSAYDLTEKPAKALHDYAVAMTLDPNLDGPDRDLKKLVESTKAAGNAADPIAYEAPKKGLKVTYLQTLQVKQAKKDEMEEAIGALAGWFKKKRVPMPKRKALVVRAVIAHKDGATTVRPYNKHPDINRNKPPAETLDYYRTMWPTVFPMGNTGELLTIENDPAPLDALWPLKPGTKGTGSAKLTYIGPDPLTPQAQFLGCKKPGDRIPFGTITWTGGVVAREKVVVPAGVFDTVAIRFEETMEMSMFGRTRKVSSTITWWYAPSVRWWVKRTRDIGEDIIVDEAEAIE